MASPLTDKQWEQIRVRLLAGEKGRALAREFGVSESAIRKRFGAQTKQIKKVAHQLVKAEQDFSALPISAQISARTLADELKAISMHTAGAARFSAASSHKLAGIANMQVEMIDDTNPMADQGLLQGIAVLQEMSNKAAVIPTNLLNANKEMIKDLNSDTQNSDKPMTLQEFRARQSSLL
jgi:hypothetical protein